MKYILRSLLILSLAVFGIAGCTSKNVEEQDTDAAELTGEESGDEVATEESADSEEISEEGGGAADEAEESTDTAEAEDSGGGEMDELATDEAVEGEESGDAEESTDVSELEDGEEGDEASDEAPEDTTAADTATTGAPAEDLSTLDSGNSGLSGDEMAGLSETTEPEYKPVVPLKKMLTTPYTKNGKIVNAIYIARDGDTLESVSQKIYGQDNVAELKNLNGHVANRDLKVGDKIYYNSPRRPTDEAQILTYYEDANLTPEVYETQSEGENIRTIAKRLLGNENSWKELWATNLEVESKDALPMATRLRYWGAENVGAAVPPPTMADSTPSMPTEPPSSEVPAPPSEPMLDDSVAGTMPDGTSAGTVEPPPPPPPVDASAPPPPPPVASEPVQTADAGDSGMMGGSEEDQMFLIGGGVLLIAAVLLLVVIIRKKRSKRGIDFQTATHTQIE